MSRTRTAIAAAAAGAAVIGSVAYGSSGLDGARPGGRGVNRPIPTIPAPPGAARIAPPRTRASRVARAISAGFTGVTFKDHRDADNGDQTNDTPPDQGLCEGNGIVIEPVNTTFATYTTFGVPVSGPTSLTTFFTGQHEVDRSREPPTYGPFLSDPRCYYDPVAKRFVMTILQVPFTPQGDFVNGRSNILIAVSNGPTPAARRRDWTILRLNTTDDGGPANDGSGNTLPTQPGCPCFGDQPLLGADRYGIYVSTNEFSDLGPEFNGAQIYAIDKRALFQGTLKYQAFHGAPTPLAEGVAYSVQPATSPTAGSWSTSNGGTEYFLSALDFTGGTDDRIAVWALTDTSSLDAAHPAVTLTAPSVVTSEVYGFPPNAAQKTGPIPLGTTVGNRESQLATDDDRMNQVVFAAGKLWGALNTVVRTPGAVSGIAYFVVRPSTPTPSTVAGTVVKQGYIALPSPDSVFYPSVAVNAQGKGAIVFTISGGHYFPSAGVAPIDATNGAGPVGVAAAGAAPADDHSGYPALGGSDVARWGDYSAATVGDDGRIWMATEYIPGGFGYPPYLSNWGTFVANVQP